MIASRVYYSLVFALAVVVSRFALALLTSNPVDWASARRTLVFPVVAVILVGLASGVRPAPATPGGENWFPDAATFAELGAWLLVASVGMAILLRTSAGAFRAWRASDTVSPSRVAALWLLILLPAGVVGFVFAASGLSWR